MTTPDLKVPRFDPARMWLSDGTREQAHVLDVPFVRFREQVLARETALTSEDGASGSDPAYAHESTRSSCAPMRSFKSS